MSGARTRLPDPGVRHTAYQSGSGKIYSAPGRNHTIEHRTRPLDSTTHTPSVRGQEGLWHRDHRRVRSLRAPEPEVVVPMRGRVPVAVGRAHVERVIVPPAAAQDGLVGLALACGAGTRHRHSAESNSIKYAPPQAVGSGARGIELFSVIPINGYMALKPIAAMKCYVTCNIGR